MILLNFAHPLTGAQREQIERLAGQAIARVVDAPAQFDHQQPFEPQLRRLFDGLPVSPIEWQTAPIVVNPPSLNFIAVMLAAELHGRMGYFAPCVRLRPVKDALPPRYEVAELINVQAIRDAARVTRRD